MKPMLVPFFLTVNEVEICFHGMSRSGNHAVIDWIISMYSGKVDFWNNVDITRCPLKLAFHKKEFLLRSHENFSLSQMSDNRLEKYHDLYMGKSRKRFNVLLLRDPFNRFASLIQACINTNRNYEIKLPIQPKIWKEHAREYLGITSYLTNPKILISYNRWFLDRHYRQQIADALALPYHEETLQRVVGPERAGAGSSFDIYQYNGQAFTMNVLERWKKLVDNPKYRSVFQDPEIWSLSTEIFGTIPETESLLEKV